MFQFQRYWDIRIKSRRVKKGLYFRTGRQDRMTQKDLIQLKDLKIKTQIDLRKSEKILIKEKVIGINGC